MMKSIDSGILENFKSSHFKRFQIDSETPENYKTRFHRRFSTSWKARNEKVNLKNFPEFKIISNLATLSLKETHVKFRLQPFCYLKMPEVLDANNSI